MSYQNRLKEFFKQNDPDRLYLAKKIARSFRDDEDAVMKRLEEIYGSGGPSKLVYKELAESVKPSTSVKSHDANDSDTEIAEHQDDNAKPKSKKKLIIIVLAVILLVVGGYFGSTMFMGGGEDNTTIEEDKNDSIVNAVEEKINQASSHSDTTVNHSDNDTTSEEIKVDSTAQELMEAAEALDAIR
mgnify:CR=1 FL=1|tara:strand:- start:5409 stop:5966 length:558 start_codon:yes stop_codon:yes gene_type:complete